MEDKMRSRKVFWRTKGHKNWKIGYIINRSNGKILIGKYIGDSLGGKYIDEESIEIEEVELKFEDGPAAYSID
jgi:hypothetical protein